MQIYIHIPFCKKKCLYCDFNSYANCSHELILRYLNGLNREIKLAGKVYGKDEITSIFIGGGTPSLLDENEIKSVFDTIKNHFKISYDAEITIEANPESFTEGKAVAFKSYGVNRLSLGVQSLDDNNLRAVGRIHDVATAKSAIKLAREYFDNISCDLIVGLPFDTKASVENEVKELVGIVDHISVYQLILEEGTPLEKLVKEGKITLPDDDETIDLFDIANKTLKSIGFERYEVSNFAKCGKYSHHNFGYWTREEYLGIGAGASTFLKPRAGLPLENEIRYSSAEGIEDYIRDVEAASEYFDIQRYNVEHLDGDAINDEQIMLGLRTCKGVDRALLSPQIIDKYSDYLEEEGSKVHLNDKGFNIMNTILVDALSLNGNR